MENRAHYFDRYLLKIYLRLNLLINNNNQLGKKNYTHNCISTNFTLYIIIIDPTSEWAFQVNGFPFVPNDSDPFINKQRYRINYKFAFILLQKPNAARSPAV